MFRIFPRLGNIDMTCDINGHTGTAAETWSVSCNGENRPVRFENAGTQTVVECGYDSQGRRFFKKVSVAGTVVLHERYVHDAYLQIAPSMFRRTPRERKATR